MKKLFFGLFLLCASLSYGAGLPEPPTPYGLAKPVQYDSYRSTFGLPAPWYLAPPAYYNRPFDNYYYQSQPSMYYICGSYGLYYTQRIR